MCIIAAVLPNLMLDKETFDRCWDKNPDGFGMSYVYKGTLRIKKTMFKKNAWSLYHNVHRIAPESAKILHFRIGTHGTKDISNCHPFSINKELCFAHNGIIKNVPDCDKNERNDTRVFNDMILKNLPPDFYKWTHYHMLLEAFIDYSKLVFMTRANALYIINEKKGEWHEGIWFSNSGYKACTYYEKKYENKCNRIGYYNGKSIAEMSDNEFALYCKWAYGDNYVKGVDNSIPIKKLEPTEPDAYDYHQCEYCMTYRQNCKKYDNIGGYMCQDCVGEMKQKIGPEFDNMSLDDILTVFLETNDTTTTTISDSSKDDEEWSAYYGQHFGSL